MVNFDAKNAQLYWILQVLGWGTFSLIHLFFKYIKSLTILGSDVWFVFMIFVLGIFFSHMIRFVYKHFKWHEQNLATILHKVAILGIFTGITKLFVLYAFVSQCPKTVHHSFDYVGFFQLALRFSFVYFVWGILYFIVYFFSNFKKSEIENLKNKAQMNEANLNKLKSQLNPHFMFNAMNVIRALIDEDKSKAKDGITQLSNILRQTLNVNQQKVITVKEELAIVQDYLSLEKLRFEERLQWQVNIADKILNYEMPPMLLQTIVENAIKHGISNLVEGGSVEISSKETTNGFQICVTNDGQYRLNTDTKGLGLSNSRERLAVIFGEQANISIENLNDKKVITCIQLPKQIEP